MEIEQLEVNIFSSFFGAAYSVIIFGPFVIPLTNNEFVNNTNYISICIVLGFLIISFWSLVKNSIGWSNEENTSVESEKTLKKINEISNRRHNIMQIAPFLYILVPRIIENTNLLNQYQVSVWLFTITILLLLQYYETKRFLRFGG